MNKATKVALSVAAIGGAFALGTAAGAQYDQPHMARALDHLQAARAELVQADADKGGYRAAAIRHVDQAIAATRRGVRFDRRH